MLTFACGEFSEEALVWAVSPSIEARPTVHSRRSSLKSFQRHSQVREWPASGKIHAERPSNGTSELRAHQNGSCRNTFALTSSELSAHQMGVPASADVASHRNLHTGATLAIIIAVLGFTFLVYPSTGNLCSRFFSEAVS